MKETYVIVGAGQAGANAAFAMRKAGFAGRVILIGEEPVPPYERPPLSKEALTAEEAIAPTFVRSEGDYEACGIELVLGRRATRVEAVSRTIHLDDGTVLAFDRLLLTTGGAARRLGCPGAEHVATLRTLADAARIRASLRGARRVLCIGAGVIGLEVAASVAKLGAEVTVLEAGQRVMERCVPPEVSEVIEQLHRQQGVHLCLEEGLVEVRQTGTGYEALTAAGSLFAADLIVAGIGIARDLALAESAGVAVDGGIVVNEFGETSVKGIYAAGDVASVFHPLYGRHVRLENWRHAQNHAIAVGRTMAAERTAYDEVPSFWTDQFDLHLQVCGFPDEAADMIVRGDLERRDFVILHLDDSGRLIAATAANRARDFRIASKLAQTRARIDRVQACDTFVPLQRLLAA